MDGLTFATTKLTVTANSFSNSGTSTTLYKNLGEKPLPIAFATPPNVILTNNGPSLLTMDCNWVSETKFVPRVMFNGTSAWLGSSVTFSFSVLAIGVAA